MFFPSSVNIPFLVNKHRSNIIHTMAFLKLLSAAVILDVQLIEARQVGCKVHGNHSQHNLDLDDFKMPLHEINIVHTIR